MGTLRDFLRHENEFARKELERLGSREADIDVVLSASHVATRYPHPLMEGGAESLAAARLLVDVAVSVEQAILCTIRAQPRLGWASLRIAAEATKNLECIRATPDLCKKWIATAYATSRTEAEQAQQAFAKARRAVPHTPITRMCQATMWLSSTLGAHPNAAALGSMGLMPEDIADLTITVPVRVTDGETLDWHLSQLVRHAARVTDAMLVIRLASLPDADRTELQSWRTQLRRLAG